MALQIYGSSAELATLAASFPSVCSVLWTQTLPSDHSRHYSHSYRQALLALEEEGGPQLNSPGMLVH